ncbi:phytanoyl-CoA dioxygenase family protein [Corallococcus sp. Z5C101001]|uniref:phytanoyl-CoA dioxygenase family protein n=1 Tax=Corallococcus sp. Z5C101001 TaxID=2596829 RepID=UPI00117EE350|nr:phytanoyl-CoA dioxygenase family protein [Corallococcus sp. Z5C101001]TSC26796.1 phytanoyl-CoA dioxygenase family protein [Corallococcus sp. Z5C101001]
MSVLSPEQCQRFATDGYLVLPSFVDGGTCERMRAVIQEQLATGEGPVEYEADVAYPGSPASRTDEGGRTVRRLLKAHGRSPLFAAWFDDARMVEALGRLLDGPVVQARAHHNCVMTKQPRYSSDTGWHQDVRYWAFARPELISTWLALGAETPENGGLKVLPGTHRMAFAAERYDERLFLRPELPENAALIAETRYVRLAPGDVLLFHARLFHAASRNHTADTKYSVVATYRRTDNPPAPGSRSARE